MSHFKTTRTPHRHLRLVPRFAHAALCLLIAAALTGCSQEPDPRYLPVFPAKGTITFKGKVPEGASLALHPKDPQLAKNPKFIPPRASVQPDGTFALTSYQSNDGAVPVNTC